MAPHRRNTEKTSSAARNAYGHKRPTSKAKPAGLSARDGWIWGRHAVLAALSNSRRKTLSLHVTRNAQAELEEADKPIAKVETPGEIASHLPDSAVHQGFALKTTALEAESLNAVREPTHGLLLVLDQITDPQNVGALMHGLRVR